LICRVENTLFAGASADAEAGATGLRHPTHRVPASLDSKFNCAIG
jgi:hypothetical protein